MIEDEDHMDKFPLLTTSSAPVLESFHVASWYVLRYCGTVVDATELILWRALLTMPVNVVSGTKISVNFLEELELLLRLALRNSTWMRVRQIEERYSDYMHVIPALKRLCTFPVEDLNDRNEAMKKEMQLSIIGGKEVAKLLLAGDEDAKEVLRTAKVSELRQLLCLLWKNEDGDSSKKGELKARDIKKYDVDVDKGAALVEEVDDTLPRRTSTSVRRPSTALPLRKEELINRILSLDCTEASLSITWDALVGPLCRVHQRLKTTVCRVSEMFYTILCPCGTGGVLSDLGRPYLPHPPSAAILLLAPKLLSLREVNAVCAPTPPWYIRHSSSEHPFSGLTPLCLFSSPEALTSYMEASRLHYKLAEANTSKAWRRQNLTFVMMFQKAIEDGLTQWLYQEQKTRNQKLPTISTNKNGLVSCESISLQEPSAAGSETEVLFVETMLRRGGLLYEHLLTFLPKHAWFACIELLVPMLQYNKKYDLANVWLRQLLEDPVYIVKSASGAATLPLYYRFQKRGKWWHRIAQNLVFLGDKKTALGILETQQQSWRQNPSTHHYIRTNEIKNLPMSIQRRARFLSAVFPSVQNTRHGCRNEIALYNAVGEHHRLHFCRRSDRIAIERTLASLHRFLRRWTPLPASYMSFTTQLLVAKEVTIYAARDPVEPRLWRDICHTWPSCGVEEHVLRWFGVGQRHDAWIGLHCEGRWIACMARLLLWDAYVFDSCTNEHTGVTLDVTNKMPDFLWLSPFQNGPLDLISTISFFQRRRQIIEERLEFFEQCSRDTLIKYVKQRFRLNNDLSGSASSIQEEVRKRTESSHEDGSEVSLLCSMNEEMVLPGQPSPCTSEQREEALPSFFFCNNISASQLTDVGDLPLLSLFQAIPQRPLCALLRCIYLSPPEEGYTIRFSGFPDLVLWHDGTSPSGEVGFKLVEVKSPNDTLSNEQIAVLDTLCRCGFDVCVVRVVESDQALEGESPCKTHRVDVDYVQDDALTETREEEGRGGGEVLLD